MRVRATDEGGFTLVETVVAALIMVVGILGGISVFDSSRREAATGERQQVALTQAQAEIERIRDIPYDELALDADSAKTWQASGAPGNPTNRVVSGSPVGFKAFGSSSAEELVFTTVGAGVTPFETVSLAMGSATLNARIYRFISWRDEECPVLDLEGMIDPLTGPTGAIGIGTGLLGTLLGAGSPLNTLLGPLFGLLNPVVKGRLTFLDGLLDNINGDLLDLIAALEGLDEIDPCDADLEVLYEIDETLSDLNPLLTAVSSRVLAYRQGCTLFLCPGTGSALYIAMNQAITNLQNADMEDRIQSLTDAVTDLEFADHERNTKRVTVAVVLDSREGSGVTKPVWATSVVTDPDAGLLTP